MKKNTFNKLGLLFKRILGAFALSILQISMVFSQTISITTPTVGQSVAANTNFQIKVNTTGIVSKVVYWVDNWTWLGESTTSPYSFNYNFPLSNGSHIIKARLITSNGTEVDAAERLFIVDTQAPTVPAGLSSASINQTSFTLNWTASTDNVGVTGYEVFRNGTSIGTPTSNSFAVTGLSAGTAYSMTVRTRDAAGNWSVQSTALSITTSANTIKSISIINPTAGQTMAVNANINLNVSTSGNVSSVIYWVDNWKWLGEVSMPPFTLNWTNNLANGSHIIKARATFSDGTTLDAIDRNFIVGTIDSQPPSTPINILASNIAQTSFSINWTASTDNVGVTGYEVFRNGTSIGTPTANFFAMTGLSAGTAYSMTVRARDATGNWSAQSTALSITTSAATPPPSGTPKLPIGMNINSTNYYTKGLIYTDVMCSASPML